MNPAVILSKAVSIAKRAGSGAVLLAKAHAPEILIGTGLVGFGATVVGACKATGKAHDILEIQDELIEQSVESMEKGLITGEEHDENIRKIKRNTRWEIAKVFTPTGTMFVLTVCCILGGYKIIHGRYVISAALAKSLETGWDWYRENVVAEYGPEADWKLMHGMTQEEEAERAKLMADRKAATKEEKKKIDKAYAEQRARNNRKYEVIFDHYSERWRDYWNSQQVLEYVRQKTRELNDKLRIRGYLFLNELYEAFGVPPISDGQLVGWIWLRGRHEPTVSVGLEEMPEEVIREILGTRRNEDIRVWLSPNPDGVIYNLIDRKDYTVVD